MIEITVPRLGWSMEEGSFSEWLKRDGEWVEKGDMLFVLESDKAAQEIESFDAGVLRIGPAGPKPGDTVRVGQVIGYLLGRDEPRELPAAAELETGGVSATNPQPVSLSPAPAPAATPFNLRETTLVHPETMSATGEPRRSEQPFASPRARRAASEQGVDWRTLTGTGRRGRIRERDVLAARASGHLFADKRDERGAQGAGDKALSISATRRAIAERMVASVRSTAPVTLTARTNALNLVNLRSQFKAAASGDPVPGVTDIVVKLAAIALRRHPEINSRWQDDKIVHLAEISIGLAVDTEAGLLVPVIRSADRMSLREIATQSRSLVDKARHRRLSAEELRGGTFTVSNLGAYGIDAFTPIINPPETAILGVGSIRREAIVLDDDRIVPGETLTLSLTFDHRAVDGAPAARFLQTLRNLIENPAAWLVG
ncbi:MAG TPA: dihydrolipoamide acetyltransferase family protein [Pirellulales bacterium]|nr:dihydrolipoamide acetyltransferase family protein [Pirellulales bacterium]